MDMKHGTELKFEQKLEIKVVKIIPCKQIKNLEEIDKCLE